MEYYVFILGVYFTNHKVKYSETTLYLICKKIIEDFIQAESPNISYGYLYKYMAENVVIKNKEIIYKGQNITKIIFKEKGEI